LPRQNLKLLKHLQKPQYFQLNKGTNELELDRDWLKQLFLLESDKFRYTFELRAAAEAGRVATAKYHKDKICNYIIEQDC
jgi:hypothetical protein